MRVARALLLAVLAAWARPAAGELDLSGTVGGGYRRTDDWVLSDHSASTLWDWSGSLSLSGSPIRPEVMQFRLGTAYLGQANLYGGTTTRADNLTFLGSLSLLSHAVSPLAATLGASLTNVDFHSSDPATGQATGSSRTLSYSGNLGFAADRLPSVQVFSSRTESTSRSFGAPETEASTTYLSVNALQNLSNHSYGILYETSWNDGTYADTNYRTHRARIDLSSQLGKDVRFQLNENYYLRLPTAEAATNPRYDDNALRLGLSWTPSPRQSHRFGYRYGRQLADFTAAPDRELSAQGLTYSTDYRMDAGLTLGAVANLDYAMERLGTAETRSAGQGLSGTLDWRYPLPREPTDAIRLGVGVGGNALEPAGRPADFGYSLRGTAGWETARPTLGAAVTYQGSYGTNAGVRAGWSTSHQIRGDARWQLGPRASLTGQAVLSLTVTDSDLFGRSESRSTSLSATYALLAYTVQLLGGLSYGVFSTMQSPSGALLPQELSSTSRYLALRLTAPLFDRLRITGDARVSGSSVPGRPTQVERGISVTAGYSLGLWSLSLTEQYSTGGAGSYDRSGNYLVIQVSRAFGARF